MSAADWCEFKTTCKRETWSGFPHTKPGQITTPRKLLGPDYGDPPRDPPIKRCPLCNKRLKLWAVFCVGGEFVCWSLPDHKPRVTRKPGPRRQSKINGRGK